MRSLLEDWTHTHPPQGNTQCTMPEKVTLQLGHYQPRDSRHVVMEEEAGSSVLPRPRSCLDRMWSMGPQTSFLGIWLTEQFTMHVLGRSMWALLKQLAPQILTVISTVNSGLKCQADSHASLVSHHSEEVPGRCSLRAHSFRNLNLHGRGDLVEPKSV